MIAHQLVEGVLVLEPYKGSPYETCVLAKNHQTRIPCISLLATTCSLELLHNDVCSPMSIPSRTCNHYILTIIDDYSRFTWVYPIPNKPDVFPRFRLFKTVVEKQLNLPLSCLRSDRGGSIYLTLSTHSSIKMESVIYFTTARTPHQNGVVERKNRTLLECTRNLAIDAAIPTIFWDKLVLTANHILNYCSTRSIKQSTPYQRINDKKPSLFHLCAIGHLAYIHIAK